MLHQKNVQVTAYYAAPPWQQVLATANSLLDKFATHLGEVEEAFVRAPAELQRQLEEAKAQVGSLNKIPGGDCTCHALCPISFACTGCVYNVPDPDREDEIVEQEQWAHIRLDQVKRRGQGPEIVKMQALIQRCHVQRQEIQLIRTYRNYVEFSLAALVRSPHNVCYAEFSFAALSQSPHNIQDETYVPTITIERDEQPVKQPETVVTQTLRSETAANGATGQGRRRSDRQGETNRDD